MEVQFKGKQGIQSEKKKRERIRELQYNPCPGRSPRELMRIKRTLEAINERLEYWLLMTEYKDLQWYPFANLISEKDEDYFYTMESVISDSEITDTGLILDMDNSAIKATNRIEVVTWYENQIERGFFMVRSLHSPLPCSYRGRLPLSRSQWNIVAANLVASRCMWQWVHSVRDYTEDETFNLGGILGWYPVKNFKIETLGPETTCTGEMIYSHILEKFLKQSEAE